MSVNTFFTEIVMVNCVVSYIKNKVSQYVKYIDHLSIFIEHLCSKSNF